MIGARQIKKKLLQSPTKYSNKENQSLNRQPLSHRETNSSKELVLISPRLLLSAQKDSKQKKKYAFDSSSDNSDFEMEVDNKYEDQIHI